LGLAIAARAVGIHGGRIQARNVEGGGLVVQLTLPALQVGDPPEQTAPVKQPLEHDTATTAV
jgi:K+-sensing histidine kinase KdpD